MSIIYHHDIVQGSAEWHELRRGIITASTAGTLITPTGKIADNDSVRKLAYKLAAERITGRVEKSFVSYEMERGNTEEGFARDLYSKTYAPVTECGFIESSRLGFRVGYSPDGLIDDDGLIEIKSRQSKYQIQTICSKSVPSEYMLQLQFGLWVSQRKWIDFVQYSNGMAMYRHRVMPSMFDIIASAVIGFEARVVSIINDYKMKSEGLPVAEYIQHFDGSEIAGVEE
jgi:hypothetical protein